MPDRRWTLVLVPHGAGASRSVQVSLRAFRTVVGLVSVLGIAVASLAYVTISKSVDLTRLERLERQNAQLAVELDQSQGLLTALGDTIAELADRDQQIRLLAGLEPTDPDVQRAGIGGPVAWTQRELALSEGPVGQRALEFRSDLNDLTRRANLLSVSYAAAVDSLRTSIDRLQRTPSIWPISPTVGWFSSPFTRARIHPIHHEARPHEGIDVSAPMDTPIMAPAAGRVVSVATKAGYGRMVTIDHGYGVVSRYAHCSKILVKAGDRVERNERIALVGNSGITTAPHLHYEVLVNGRPVDPLTYIFPESIVD